MMAPPVAEKRKKKTGRRGPAPTPTELGRNFRFPPDVNRDSADATIKVYPDVLELLNKIKGYYGYTVADTLLVFWAAMQAEHMRLMKREMDQMNEKKPVG